MNTTIRYSKRANTNHPYVPTTTANTPRLRLDTNECPPLFSAVEFASIIADPCNRYPNVTPLQQSIACRLDIDRDRVCVTAGADDAIDRICRAFLDEEREMLVTVPTFEMIPRSARATGASIRTVSRHDEPYPIEEMISNVNDRTGVIAVVSPNNPTGEVITPADLIALSMCAPDAVILLDLAYIEFADVDLTPLALSLPNVIITCTFSKAYGLAGLRVGYAAGSAELIRLVHSIGAPYPVTTPAIAAATLALELRERRMPTRLAAIRRERELLTHALRSQGARVTPTQGNFVYAQNAGEIADRLNRSGISVRTLIDDSIRVTCPCDEHEFAFLLDAIVKEKST